VHKAFGEDMALLIGDALLNRAFEVALADYGLEPKHVLAATKILADAAGIDGMVGGQCIDLESEGKNIDLQRLQLLQKGKTAALLSAACGMGVAIGGGSDTQLKAAMTFGENLGLAFQVIDDVLDVTAEAAVLGKPVGSDAENEKVTYVSLCGLEGAKKAAQSMTDTALRVLTAFNGDTTHLQILANALLERKQ
jgi:geranylgeranyl diphosphate synthase type II